YGHPDLLGPVYVLDSFGTSQYDAVDVHFERRFSAAAGFQVNYSLAWSRGLMGNADGNYPFTSYPITPGPDGGDYSAPWEYGPTPYDERHRLNLAGVFTLPFAIDVSPSFTIASPRPYTQFGSVNPSGDGLVYVRDASGNPAGINNARGQTMVNFNARVTKNLAFAGQNRVSVFAEFYN